MITLLLIAVVAILIASLVYASAASANLPSDDDLKSAKSRLVWVSVVGWISVAIIVIFCIFLLFEGAELMIGSSFMVYLLVFAVLGMLSVVAWLTVSSTSIIENSSEFLANKDRTASIFVSYSDSYLASALSLGTIIALILILAAYYSGRWSVRPIIQPEFIPSEPGFVPMEL